MLTRVVRSRWFAAMVGATLAAVVAGGSAVLADHQSDGAIHGCVKNRGGALRIVSDPSQCDPKTETAIAWDRQGLDGAQGLPGNLALAGQQCPAGHAVSGFDAAGDLVCSFMGDLQDADADGDGYKVGAGDCDDANPGVNPGAAEVNDGIDNDCDSAVDEPAPPNPTCDDGNPYTADEVQQDGSCAHTRLPADDDADGFDKPEVDGGDCDDSDATINPDAPEVAGDAKDNDCDGAVDEPNALNESGSPEEADFCRLDHPQAMTVNSHAQSEAVYGRLFEAGVTEAAGPAPGVKGELGFGPQGSDPRSASGWHWFGAAFHLDEAAEDQYVGELTAPPAFGQTFSYVYRFTPAGGNSPTYCDLDGAGSATGADFDPGNLGTIRVD